MEMAGTRAVKVAFLHDQVGALQEEKAALVQQHQVPTDQPGKPPPNKPTH